MNIYLVIGAAGQGKSPFVQKLIEQRRCFVFDVQNEYGGRTKYPGQKPIMLSDNKTDIRARYFSPNGRPDVNGFIAECFKKRNTMIVFEEATEFFEGRTAPEMRSLLINRYHTGNNYALIFHSISSVPPRIMQLSNWIVLFKTGDELNDVKRKYARLLPAFEELRGQPDGTPKVIKNV